MHYNREHCIDASRSWLRKGKQLSIFSIIYHRHSRLRQLQVILSVDHNIRYDALLNED